MIQVCLSPELPLSIVRLRANSALCAIFIAQLTRHDNNDSSLCSCPRTLFLLRCYCPSRLCAYHNVIPLYSIDMFHQVSVSVPTWDKISFLDVGTGQSQIRYGVFGFTGSKIAIGYIFQGLK